MNSRRTPVSELQAEQIARAAIYGKIELSLGARIQIKRKQDMYIVTFLRNNRPGERAADYDAQLTMDAYSGDILELLGGS